MKLGLQLGYWGAQPNPFAVSLAQEAERLGFDSVWTAEAWGSDAFTPARVDRRAHRAHPPVHRHRADLGAHAGVVRDARAHARPSVERPVHARARRVGAAGGRGLVRPAVRQAARAHARVRRHRAARAAARGAGRVRGRALPACRTTARTRGGSASRCGRSRIRCAPTCRSCSAPKVRRTSRSRPRSPTVGCRSTTRRSGPRCTPTRCARRSPASRSA